MKSGLRLFILNYVVVMIASPWTMLHTHHYHDQHEPVQHEWCYQNQIIEDTEHDRHHENHDNRHCLFCQWQSHSHVVIDFIESYSQFTNQQFLSACPEQVWFQFFLKTASSRAPPQYSFV